MPGLQGSQVRESLGRNRKISSGCKGEAMNRVFDCVFCEFIHGQAPVTLIWNNDHNVMIVPLNPVVPGHVLVIPKTHVDNFLDWPYETGRVMQQTAEWVKELAASYARYKSVNIITSVGEAATQTVGHLHIHVVPRAVGDGLTLPWTDQLVYNKTPGESDVEQERLAQA